MDNTCHRKRNDYKIDMAIDTFWHESIVHKIGKVLINHMIFSLYCASIGDCFYSKKVLGEYLISLKRFLPLMEIETDIFDTITVDNLGQFSRELCKLDQITAP